VKKNPKFFQTKYTQIEAAAILNLPEFIRYHILSSAMTNIRPVAKK